MRTKKDEKFKLESVEELLGVVNEESAMDIEISKIQPFRAHPFKVLDDDKMQELIDSISVNGILTPVLVRPLGMDTYEMISGHRRMHAAKIVGLTKIPTIIREMTDDEAVINMVDANVQREELLPSEKAFAYKMKLDAMKHQGQRTDLTSNPQGRKLVNKETAQIVGEENGDSQTQVRRYVRLTYLVPELLEMVDEGRIKMRPAVEISYLDEDNQRDLVDAIDTEDCTPSHAQTIKMRKFFDEGKLSSDVITSIMQEEKPNQKEKIVIPNKTVEKYIPKSIPAEKRQDYVCKALEHYGKYLQKMRDRESR